MSNPTETVSNGYDPSTGDFSTDPRRDNGAISPVICARHDLGDGECILCSPCAFRDSFAQAPLIIVETVKAEVFRTTTRSRYAVVPVSSPISSLNVHSRCNFVQTLIVRLISLLLPREIAS